MEHRQLEEMDDTKMSEANMNNTPESAKTDRNQEQTALANELRERMLKINRYLQFPEAEHLVDLVGDDLIEKYGRDQVEAAADLALFGTNDELPELSEQYTRLFDRFNRRYFDGALPPYTVHVRLSISYYGRTIWQECHCIELLAGSESWMVVRLLQEMAHIATTRDYNQRWRDELHRLDAVGAPIDVYPDMRDISAEQFITETSGRPFVV